MSMFTRDMGRELLPRIFEPRRIYAKNQVSNGKVFDLGDYFRGSVHNDCTRPESRIGSCKEVRAEEGGSRAGGILSGPPDKTKWMQFAPGVEYGAVYGHCDKVGAPCVFQLRFADGAKFPPHWQPVDENVTVLSGTFLAGMGDSYDESKLTSLPVGTYVFMPRRMHHFAGAKGVTVVQVHGVGPFKINYVNPADDPAKGAKAAD